ncbi:MAG: hypothetical protein U0414_40440 [Polyangiaceae bacterium]
MPPRDTSSLHLIAGAALACAAAACSPVGPPVVSEAPSVSVAASSPSSAERVLPQAAADPEDTRPPDRTLTPPPGDFSALPLPPDVHTEPPADGWWKEKDACPAGRNVVTKKLKRLGQPWIAYSCDGGKGGPSTAIREDADEREEGFWDDDGKPHGAVRWLTFAYDDTRLYVHGVSEGRWTDRARSGNQDSFQTFRAGKCHGEQRRDLGGRASGGYCVDGHSEGIWLVWNTQPDIVRARLRYAGGELHGAQRWWTRDGAVLARGRFIEGRGTWGDLAPDGKIARGGDAPGGSSCKRAPGPLSNRAPVITLRACGPAAPPGCEALGPTDARERVAIGADVSICDDPTVPPLALF